MEKIVTMSPVILKTDSLNELHVVIFGKMVLKTFFGIFSTIIYHDAFAFKLNRYTSKGNNSVLFKICLPSLRWSTLKGKNLLLTE